MMQAAPGSKTEEREDRFAAIENEAAAILKAEGAFKVRGVYFVLESDATMARMVEAERRVAERDRSMDQYIARRPVARAVAVVSGIGRSVVADITPAAHCPEMSVTEGAEPVNAETPVIWEGELTTWGSLAGNERQMCEFNNDGVLEGGFPF